MKITLTQIMEALKKGYSVEVIINGEFYDFYGKKGKKNER